MYVYCACNPSMPGLVKIGRTADVPSVRIAVLSASTSVAMPFELKWYAICSDSLGEERKLHKVLSAYRVSGRREFFRCSPETARNAAKSVGMVVVESGLTDGGEPYVLGYPASQMKALAVASPFMALIWGSMLVTAGNNPDRTFFGALLIFIFPLLIMAIANIYFAIKK